MTMAGCTLEPGFIKIGGLRVRYVDTKKGENAMLLIHGLGGAIESWANNIDYLSKELRVIALDLPGFGHSDKPELDYTTRFYCDFVARFAEELQIAPATIVGSSLGGQVAAEVAINHPRVVSRLVMISPAGALPRSFSGTPALKKYVRILKARTVAEVKKAIFAVDHKPVDDAYAKIVYEKLAMPGAKRAFLSALTGSAKAPRLASRLGKIKAPAMVLWGKDDIMIPVKYAEPYVRMKNCRVVLLERCGHRPHVDRAATFNRLVAGFAQEG